MTKITVCQDADDLAERAAEFIIEKGQEAVRARQRFTLVLAGGSTPEKTYSLLAQPDRAARIDWTHTDLFFGDERLVPSDDPDSNFGMARRSLIARIPIPPSNVFPISTRYHTAAAAAAVYAKTLSDFFAVPLQASPPRFDLILLGLGDDGHTASLFPGAPSLDVTEAWVTDSPPGVLPPPEDRITLTYPVLNAAHKILFLVSGEKKATALYDVLEGGASRETRPAAGVQPTDGEVDWLVDQGAAKLLTHFERE